MSGDAVDPVAPASASSAGAGGGAESGGDEASESRFGRRAGVALGIAAVVGLAVLAGFGFTPALYLLVLAFVGTLMVVVGARLH